MIHKNELQEAKQKRKLSKKQVSIEYITKKAEDTRIEDAEEAEFIGKLVGSLAINSAINISKARITFGKNFSLFWRALSAQDLVLGYLSTSEFSLERPDEHPAGCVVYRTRDSGLFTETLITNERFLRSKDKKEKIAPIIQAMLSNYLGYALSLPDGKLERAVRNTQLLDKYKAELTPEDARKLSSFDEMQIYKKYRDNTDFHRIANDYLIGWVSAPVGWPGNDKEIGDFSLDGVMGGNSEAKRLREVTIERLTGKSKNDANVLESKCYCSLVNSVDWTYYPKTKKLGFWHKPIHAAFIPNWCKERAT